MRTLLAGVLGFLIACGGKPTAPMPTPLPLARAAPKPVPAKPTFAGAPATPTGDQLAWVLDAIVHRHGVVERAELEAHFAPTFLTEVPSDQLAKALEQMATQLASLTLASVEGLGDRLIAHAIVGDTKLRISLAINDAGQIQGLLIQPDIDAAPRPHTFEDALRTAPALAPKAQLLVAALDKGTCKPLQELAASDELAIGSTFKLYVLLGLADRVIAGKAAWTDELAVRDDWKSLPSGTTQNELPGTKHSLQQFAERMISISDNTAADHLLYTVGRKQVEAALREAKHARPALDTPFLATRELFVMKLGTPADELERYLKLPEAKRRDYLDKTLAAKQPNVKEIPGWTTARRVGQLEWFASAEDLCRAMATLWTRAQDPKAAAVLDILAKNPGLPIDKKVWPYVGFKGGSEPGVVNMTYLLRRDDGQWFVVVLGFNADEGGKLDDAKIFNLAAGVIELTGQAR
ncbi:MAG TPA: serine hydrolase [Kofleriaceae bacterium]|jgi:beta-lactamase class A|nr:serine hydrolase [Kofleriaceae bacterium]